MRAAAEGLAKLPGIEPDIGRVGTVDRRLDDHCRGAMAGAGRPALDQPLQVFGEAGHVEGAVLHPDIDVVGPGAGILVALGAGQHMAAMSADIIDRLACAKSSIARLIWLATTRFSFCSGHPMLRSRPRHLTPAGGEPERGA